MKSELSKFFWAVIVIACHLSFTGIANADSTTIQTYSERGLTDCLKCHGEDAATPVVAILNTPHAVMSDANSPFGKGNHTCEGCHGESSLHIEKYDDDNDRPQPAINFGSPEQGYSSVAAQNEVCQSCHENLGHLMDWQGSAHQVNDVTCSGCHQSHMQQDPVMQRETQAEVCSSCHTTERLEARKASHHPMNEGIVICTDCHGPHGTTGEASLIKATINDTCYSCHAEKRGPFLWEHEPVQESCSNCHFAHGSNNQRLLKVRPPYLCQQCHSEGHSDDLYNAKALPSSVGNGNARDMQKLYVKGCINCHSQLHGSNHPSGVRRHR